MAWFLEIAFVQDVGVCCVRVCASVCVCVHLCMCGESAPGYKLHSHDIEPVQPVN